MKCFALLVIHHHFVWFVCNLWPPIHQSFCHPEKVIWPALKVHRDVPHVCPQFHLVAAGIVTVAAVVDENKPGSRKHWGSWCRAMEVVSSTQPQRWGGGQDCSLNFKNMDYMLLSPCDEQAAHCFRILGQYLWITGCKSSTLYMYTALFFKLSASVDCETMCCVLLLAVVTRGVGVNSFLKIFIFDLQAFQWPTTAFLIFLYITSFFMTTCV